MQQIAIEGNRRQSQQEGITTQKAEAMQQNGFSPSYRAWMSSMGFVLDTHTSLISAGFRSALIAAACSLCWTTFALCTMSGTSSESEAEEELLNCDMLMIREIVGE
jgi:hypothetical protein